MGEYSWYLPSHGSQSGRGRQTSPSQIGRGDRATKTSNQEDCFNHSFRDTLSYKKAWESNCWGPAVTKTCMPWPILRLLTPEPHRCELHRNVRRQGRHYFSLPGCIGLYRTGVQQRPHVDGSKMILPRTGQNISFSHLASGNRMDSLLTVQDPNRFLEKNEI